MTEEEIQKYLDQQKIPALRYGQDTRVIASIMMLSDTELENPDKVTFFNSIRDVIDLGDIPAWEWVIPWSLKHMEDRIAPIIRRSRSFKDADTHPINHLFRCDKSCEQEDGRTLLHLEPVNPIGKLFPDVVYKYEALDNSPKDVKNIYILFESFSNMEIDEHKSKYQCIMPEILMRTTIDNLIKSDTSS